MMVQFTLRFTALKHILYTLLTICDNIDGPLPLRTSPLSLSFMVWASPTDFPMLIYCSTIY